MSKDNAKAFENALSSFKRLASLNEEAKANGKHDYSLLTALLNKNDEVRLHSRFLYSMLNPDAFHYCGEVFLKAFLDNCGLTQRFEKEGIRAFDYQSAFLEIEKDNIDLAIYDGYHIILIENKLNAGDQKHQITRYINAAIKRFELDPNDAEAISKRLSVIYLSKHRQTPSAQSIIGFEINERADALIWKGANGSNALEIANVGKKTRLPAKNQPSKWGNTLGFKLAYNTAIRFTHLAYFGGLSPSVSAWIDLCIDALDSKDVHIQQHQQDLRFSFQEYNKVLARLNTQTYRKNIMNLSDYFALQDEETKADILNFAASSRQHLEAMIATTVFEKLSKHNVISTAMELDKETHCEHEKLRDKLTITTLKNWLEVNKRTQSRVDIGLILSGSPELILCFARMNIYIVETRIEPASENKSYVMHRVMTDTNSSSYHKNLLLNGKVDLVVNAIIKAIDTKLGINSSKE